MAERIIREPNMDGLLVDGARVLQGKWEYVTYPEDSSFRIWYSDVPWRYMPHFHSAVEMVLTLTGTVEYEAGGRTYKVEAGDVIIIPPGVSHGLNMGEDSSRFLFLFEPDAIFEMRDIKSLSDGIKRVFLLNDESQTHQCIRKQLQKAAEVYKRRDPMWNTLCYGYMMRVFALLGQRYLASAGKPKAASEKRMDSEIINNTLIYINNHYTEDITLDDAANFAGFSRYYFSRSFKKYSGYSFKDYLCEKRLQVAMDLLIHTNEPMGVVAKESGFGSVATFNRVFREMRNCTPTQYRSIYGG